MFKHHITQFKAVFNYYHSLDVQIQIQIQINAFIKSCDQCGCDLMSSLSSSSVLAKQFSSVQPHWRSAELFSLKNTRVFPHFKLFSDISALLRRKFRGQGHVWLKTFQTATGGSRCCCLLQPSNELFILIWITLPLIECDLVYYYSYTAMTRTKSTEADYYCYDDGPPTWWVYVCDCLNLLCVVVLVLYITPYICHSGLFPVTMWLPQFPCGWMCQTTKKPTLLNLYWC